MTSRRLPETARVPLRMGAALVAYLVYVRTADVWPEGLVVWLGLTISGWAIVDLLYPDRRERLGSILGGVAAFGIAVVVAGYLLVG